MEQDKYSQLSLRYKKLLKADDYMATIIFSFLLFSTLFFFWLSTTGNFFVWFLSQLMLGIHILQWFVLVHDLGHNNYFTNKRLNAILGHVASIFVILPFYPWRYIHRGHHTWTGWKDIDPTMEQTVPREFPENKKKIMNFCWKYWIPIFSLSFSFGNFWNMAKLFKMYPEKKYKKRNTFSIFFLIAFYIILIDQIGVATFIQIWALAYTVFLMLSDPLLLSQHSGVPQKRANGKKVAVVPFNEQEEYTRSLRFPHFINAVILMGFNQHIVHHFFPTMPGYHLYKTDYNSPQEENWWTWLMWAKKVPAFDLLISEEMNIVDEGTGEPWKLSEL